MHTLHALFLLSQSAPLPRPASPLPPQAQARALLIILAVAVVALLGLLALTIFRRMLRRQALAERAGTSNSGSPGELTPWEQAGRRAEPAEEDGAEGRA